MAGQRDRQHLALHRDYRCHASAAEIVAVTGNDRPEQVFVLAQNPELFDEFQRQITTCDAVIKAQLTRLTAQVAAPTTALPPARHRQKPRDHDPRFDIRTPLPPPHGRGPLANRGT